MPFPLLSTGKTSATTAVDILIFPLLNPPIILAITNSVKLCDTAHTAYDIATPICEYKLYTCCHLACFKMVKNTKTNTLKLNLN